VGRKILAEEQHVAYVAALTSDIGVEKLEKVFCG